MMTMQLAILLAGLATATVVLAGCAGPSPAASKAAFHPQYLGIQTVLMGGDLVDFRVAMKGARGIGDVDAYARCAAAQYALIRGFGFARHVRTTVNEKGDTWRGDAIYTISASLPQGLRTIDAEVTVQNCGALGIPTV